MKKIMRLFIPSISLLISACVTTAQFAPSKVAQTFSSRTPPEGIQLFRSALPTKKFFEIGAVSACCGSDQVKMIDLLKNKASESGGDALTGLDINAQGAASAAVIRFE